MVVKKVLKITSAQGLTFDQSEALRTECVNTGKKALQQRVYVFFQPKTWFEVFSDHTLTQIMMKMFNKN